MLERSSEVLYFFAGFPNHPSGCLPGLGFGLERSRGSGMKVQGTLRQSAEFKLQSRNQIEHHGPEQRFLARGCQGTASFANLGVRHVGLDKWSLQR